MKVKRISWLPIWLPFNSIERESNGVTPGTAMFRILHGRKLKSFKIEKLTILDKCIHCKEGEKCNHLIVK